MAFKGITQAEWEKSAADKKDDAAGAKRHNMTPAQYDTSILDAAADKLGIAKTNADRSKAKWPKIPRC